MKKFYLTPILILTLLSGCTASTDISNNSENVSNNPAVVSPGEMIIGYDKLNGLYDWTNTTYVVNSEGKKIIDFSDNDKQIITYNENQYVVERTIGTVTQNEEYGYYENTYDYTIYDHNGNEVGNIKDIHYASYIANGNFITYNWSNKQYYIENPFTGEKKETNYIEVLSNNDKPVALLHMDENHQLKSMSDIEMKNFKDMTEYDYGYPAVTKNKTYLIAHRKYTEYEQQNRDTMKECFHLFSADGEKLIDKDFIYIHNSDNYIRAYDGEKTLILDADTIEIIREIDGEVAKYNSDGTYIQTVINIDNNRNSYRYMSEDNRILSENWSGFNYYNGEDKGYYVFTVDVNTNTSYSYDSYLIDKNGKVILGPLSNDKGYISYLFNKGFIVEDYDSEPCYRIYDYSGKETVPEKEYILINQVSNNKEYDDIFVGVYENPVSAGYLYDILDMNFEIMYSGFNYVNAYSIQNGIISASKGFTIGLFDLKTGQWVYTEKIFNSLDD